MHFIVQSRSCIAPERAADYTSIKYGDILFAASGETVEEIGKSATNLIRDPACCGGDIIVFRPRIGVDPRFMGYAADCQPAIYQKSGMGKGFTVVHIYPSQLRNLLLSVPPLSEQRRIATFLDRETARIDALIEKKQRLIELLKEKRQAVITQAVTEGLDPKVPMKDSGVEWLGEVPEHWVCRTLGTLASVVRGASPRPAGDPRFFDGDHIPWVTVAEITRDEAMFLDATAGFLTKEGSQFSRIFRAGTLIYSNSGATLGVPKLLRITACANDGVVGFEALSKTVDIEFLYFFLISLTEDLRERIKQGAGQPNLNTEIVRNIKIALPPMVEQRAVVTWIQEHFRRTAGLIRKTQKSIDLLSEHRSALITAAVTGQIDVRDE